MRVHRPNTLTPEGLTVVKGHPLVLSQQVYRQYRFPKSHRRRIRQKWNLGLRNWTLTRLPIAIKQGNTIHCHPDLYETLSKASVSALLNNQNLGPRPSDIILGQLLDREKVLNTNHMVTSRTPS